MCIGLLGCRPACPSVLLGLFVGDRERCSVFTLSPFKWAVWEAARMYEDGARCIDLDWYCVMVLLWLGCSLIRDPFVALLLIVVSVGCYCISSLTLRTSFLFFIWRESC